jgi:hypothetical protein
MTSAPTPRSAQHIAPGPFVTAALGLYILSFVSQVLLSEPVTARLSVAPFALAQALLIICWIVLHQRRLRDAGKPTGIVMGIALIYALEVVLLIVLVAWVLSATAGTSNGVGPHAGILQLFLIIYLLTTFSSDPSLGGLQLWIFGLIVLLLLPVLIAIGFSAWAATRPSLASPP